MSSRVAAFVQRLRELGWIENRTVAIEYRWAEQRSERYAEIAAEFVRLKVDVIVTSGTPVVIATKQATAVSVLRRPTNRFVVTGPDIEPVRFKTRREAWV